MLLFAIPGLEAVRVDTDPLSIMVYVGSALELAFAAIIVWRREQGGRVLFELSRRKRVLFWAAVASVGIAAVGTAVETPNLSSRTINVLAQAFFLIVVSQASEVREHGLSLAFEFVKWDRVSGWSWSNADTVALKLHRSENWETTREFRVAPDKRAELSALLDRVAIRRA